MVVGAIAGSSSYALANWLVSRHGGRHRKRSGHQQSSSNSGARAIAIGSLLGGILESVVLGVSLLGGGGISLPVFVAVFLSNFPEGLPSATGRGRLAETRFMYSAYGHRSRTCKSRLARAAGGYLGSAG